MRTELKKFQDIIKRLHKQFSRSEYEMLCSLCKYNLSKSPITKEGTYLGNKFMRKMESIYKINNKLSYGQQDELNATLKS